MQNLKSLMAAAMLGLAAQCAFAETDPWASRWIDMLKDGATGTVNGKDGALKNPRVTGVLKGSGTAAEAGFVSNRAVLVSHNFKTVQQTVLSASAVPLTVTYGGTGTNSSGGVLVYNFPEGRILVHGVVAKNVVVTPDGNNDSFTGGDDGDFGFGTVVASGSDISTTEIDLIPKTSLSTMTNATDAALAASAQFDGTTTAKDMYFNLLVDADEITDSNAVATVSWDSVTITWSNLGDY